MHYVYMHYNIKDEVIYVGETNDISRRIDEHLDLSKGHTLIEHKISITKIKFARVTNESTALFYETYFINRLRPKYNIMKTSRKEIIDVELPILDWHEVSIH